MNYKAVGEKTQGIVIGELARRNKQFSLPFGDNQRYDVIIDESGKLIRAQIKTAKYKNGCVVFSTCSSNCHTYKRSNYRGQADVFLVYSPLLDKLYMISVDDAPTTECNLRVEPMKQKTTKRVKWAKDYEI